MKVDGLQNVDYLMNKQKQALAFDENANFDEYRKKLKDKFIELAGIDLIRENACDSEFEIEKTEQKDGYKQIRFTFKSEEKEVVPCYLLIPDGSEGKKLPVVITLQGHATGFHNSINEPKDEGDAAYCKRGQFAVQAVRRGYIALAIEQRGMGERKGENDLANRRISVANPRDSMCYYQQMTNILMGRTLIGGRCVDISRAIDMLEHFSECDTDKIVITGNSGGGTASYYAAAYDERIKISVPSCAFCPYKESILRFYHCSCNYIPSAYRYFDMQDLAALIAPRKLSIIAGRLDPSFLIWGVERGYETVKKIYEKAGAKDNCNLIETEKGHWWCEDIVYDEIARQMKSLGW